MEDKEQCFTTLIDEHLSMLRRAAYSLLKNAADVDDAIQTAMLKAWKQFGSMKDQAALTAWVYRITINCCYDIIRKRKPTEELPDNIPASDTPTERAMKEVQLAALYIAIDKLPEDQRDAIRIGVLLDISGEKAAHRLGCSVNTLYQRISRAKQTIRKTFGRC